MRWLFVALVPFVSSAIAASSSSSEAADAAPIRTLHLLRGAEAFRDGDYHKAVIEFRIAERAGTAETEATWYLAATLTQLGRADEAVETFARAARLAPSFRDELLDYYFAVACDRSGLVFMAQALAMRVTAAAGPKVEQEAKRLLEAVAPATQAPFDEDRLVMLLARAEKMLASRPEFARLLFLEASALALESSNQKLKVKATEGIVRAERLIEPQTKDATAPLKGHDASPPSSREHDTVGRSRER